MTDRNKQKEACPMSAPSNLENLIRELRECEAKATPGPWKVDVGNWQIESQYKDSYRDGIVTFFPDNRDTCDGGTNPVYPTDDADFIVECKNKIPTLLAIIERQNKALEYYANTESSVWDNSTCPPRLTPALGYGPYEAKKALTDVESMASGEVISKPIKTEP